MKKLYALANLGVYFARHWLRAIGALFGAARPDGAAFQRQFAPEGIFALTPEEHAALPRHQACIVCGLCDMGPGPARFARFGRETVAAGFARALPTLPIPAADLDRAADRPDAAALCPMGVPLRDVAAFVTRPRA